MNKRLQHNNGTISYRVEGGGEPVILLHGFAEDGSIWEHLVPLLQNDYFVIIPDLPGSGDSDLTPDVSMEAMADAVKAVCDEEKITRAVLIGHSMGGYVTLAFAERYPGMLNALGLFHSSAYSDSEEKKASREKLIQFIQTHGTHEFLNQSTPGLFSDEFKKQNSGTIDNLIISYKYFAPASLIAYYRSMMKRPDRTQVLKEFDKPILFIIGRHDNAIPFADSLELCHLPSLSYIHILWKSGHMGMIEERDTCNEILRSFLKSVG